MPPLRFATFLAPSMYPVYEYIAAYVGAHLGVPAHLHVGESFSEFAAGQADAGFICGLPYVDLVAQTPAPVALLTAPVIQGARYGGQPIYYSDVIVHRDSPYRAFADLRGTRWAYNDVDSHSGYNITRYRLVQMGATDGFFGTVRAAGWHQVAIGWVRGGQIDAAAIDSHVLALALRDDPILAADLRVIDTLGPATIQPVVAARQVPGPVQAAIRAALLALGDDPAARPMLDQGLLARFVPVHDATYDDIRAMVRAATRVGFTSIR